VENTLWKRLWTCHKTNRMNKSMCLQIKHTCWYLALQDIWHE
jgi:hypothetical protein